MKSNTIYLSGLNGIRAIAAIAVVISHTTLYLKHFGLNPYIFGVQENGAPQTINLAGFGVSMFFALSGFLITYLLRLEKAKQQINVAKFYMRRILRIWPLYYGYIIITLLIILFFKIEINYQLLPYYIFYTPNIPFILGVGLPFIGHYWSLGVEEQFYMFWPWLNRLQTKYLLIITLLLITFFISLKIYLHLFIPSSILEIIIHVTRFHCMLIGAVGAILYVSKNALFLMLTTNKIVQLFAWGVIFLTAINKFHIASFLDNEIISVITIIIIIGQVSKKGLINLENRFFDFIGKISYGIYVIHPIIIFLFTKLINFNSNRTINYLSIYLLILFVTLIVAYLSYNYFELSFLRLKNSRYSVIKSSSSMNNYTS